MPDVSSSKYVQGAGAVGSTVGSVYKLLRDNRQGKRLLRGLFAGGYSFLQTITRVARILFLQVTGFIFLCFAVIVSSGAYREYKRYTAGEVSAGKAYLAVALAIMFLYFGLSSFWRAAKKSQ